MNAGVILAPFPYGMFRLSESFKVSRGVAVLTDLEATVDFEERFRQFRVTVKEEAVGDQHEIRVGPTFAGQVQVFHQLRVKKRFAAEQRETPGAQSVIPQFIIGPCLFRGWHWAGKPEVAVVTALLACQIAAVREMVFQCGKIYHRQITFSNPCFLRPASKNSGRRRL